MKISIIPILALLMSLGLTTPSANAADLIHLAGLLAPVFTMEQFTVVCTVDEPKFMEPPTATGWSIPAYSKHMKDEILANLTGEESKVIVLSAAEAAREKVRRQLQLINKPDGQSEAAHIRRWCESVARPYIKSVVDLHDEHHDLWDQAITQAKK